MGMADYRSIIRFEIQLTPQSTILNNEGEG